MNKKDKDPSNTPTLLDSPTSEGERPKHGLWDAQDTARVQALPPGPPLIWGPGQSLGQPSPDLIFLHCQSSCYHKSTFLVTLLQNLPKFLNL